jgi:hypothetical protein
VTGVSGVCDGCSLRVAVSRREDNVNQAEDVGSKVGQPLDFNPLHSKDTLNVQQDYQRSTVMNTDPLNDGLSEMAYCLVLSDSFSVVPFLFSMPLILS